MQKERDELYENAEEAIWEEHRKRISTVWIVPIVALVVGAWLMFQSINEKGPTIKITFKSAEGIEADKTSIKYKNIEVGKVTDVNFGKDLKEVIVTAELKKNMRPYLSENTHFWVMRARLGVGKVEGLDTLLSGAYIVIDPQVGGENIRTFQGLENMPVVTTDEQGETYILKANDIGSLNIGTPIYYKKIEAGNVASYALDPDGKKISIKIFVKKPFTKLINNKTRFWNSSGITAGISADGVEIQTESLTSILLGGLAFDNFIELGKGVKVAKDHEFTLYKTRKEAKKIQYKRELYFWIYFNESIRGLSTGAPVEFRGVKIGEVVDFSLIGNADTAVFQIPILIKIEPERFTVIGNDLSKGNNINMKVLTKLVEKGFRAQLQSGNLLTGELFVDLNLHDDVPVAHLKQENGYPVIPTIPATIESLKSDIKTVLDRIAAIPFEDISKEMETMIKEVSEQTVPKINKTIDSADDLLNTTDKTIASMKKNYIDSNAQINKKLIKLLDEMTKTSRSVKNLTDYLERHPESLLKGK
jgi:paraquat-inducible protein B